MIKNKKKYDPIIIREDFLGKFSSKVVTDQIYKLYLEIKRN